jgi:uncharacterized protein (TIGR03118 family)
MNIAAYLLLGAIVAAGPVLAGNNKAPAKGSFTINKLVSDQSGVAANTDPELVNPWGISHQPAGSPWISDNGSDKSTVYDANTGTKQLVVGIPPGAPTGTVYVPPGAGFSVTENGQSGPSEFLFDTETGTIDGWAPGVDFSNTITAVDNSKKGAVYKGLAIASKQIYAADFVNNHVQIYDNQFNWVNEFTDSNLPKHFAPFNVQFLNGNLYVAFAKREKHGIDELHGKGLGYVDIFDTNGNLVKQLISKGKLNAPWGMTIAPAGFGKYAGKLLVGNFGDGKINAYDSATGDYFGTLKGSDGKPIAIDGLWALDSGPGSRISFTAGPDDETHGLFGTISAN